MAVRVTVMSWPNSVTVWACVGCVAATSVGMYVRVRHSLRPLIQARAVGVDRRGSVVQDLARGRCPSGFTGLGEHGTTRIQRGGTVWLNAFVSLAIAIPISHGCYCISAWCGIVSEPWDVV